MTKRVDFEVSERDFHRRSRCRSCKAEIVWFKSPATGKAMPLDVASAQVSDAASAGREGAPLPAITYRLESHFAHCPDAARYRGDSGS